MTNISATVQSCVWMYFRSRGYFFTKLCWSPKQTHNSTKHFWPAAKNSVWKGINMSWLHDGTRWRMEHLQQVFYMQLKHLHTFPKILQANELQNRFSTLQSSLLTGERHFGQSSVYVSAQKPHRDHLICLYFKATSLMWILKKKRRKIMEFKSSGSWGTSLTN